MGVSFPALGLKHFRGFAILTSPPFSVEL